MQRIGYPLEPQGVRPQEAVPRVTLDASKWAQESAQLASPPAPLRWSPEPAILARRVAVAQQMSEEPQVLRASPQAPSGLPEPLHFLATAELRRPVSSAPLWRQRP